eukprot:TRINITY_DN1879_c0_g1_i3.p1 TRINITY_DN1879_c0_g1~~TRINITY_DN1879_c0_g1_i3.p1  ORF type:complete len:675 (+),score=354.65 TRINITY_DN1879_c0_g1_i3:32-2026(+)
MSVELTPAQIAAKEVFLSVGFDERRASDTLKNEVLTKQLLDIITEAGAQNGTDKATGNALYTIATKIADSPHRSVVVRNVAEKKLQSAEQLKAALAFVQKVGAGELDLAKFETESGVGIVVADEEIKEKVSAALDENKDQLLAQRYAFNTGKLLGQLRKDDRLKWVFDRVSVAITAEIEARLGPKTEADLQAGKGKAKPAASSSSSAAPAAAAAPAKAAVVLTRPEGAFTRIRLADIGSHQGEKVQVKGWIHSIRSQSKLIFIELRDGTGFVQTVFGGKLSQAVGVESLLRETSIEVLGTVAKPPEGAYAKWSGLELQAEYWEIVGASDGDLEDKFNKESNVSLLFDQRHLVIRQEKVANYLRLRSVISHKIREHFYERGFTEVTPPTLVQTQAEGGSELFSVPYFNEQAYLTQSSQLYLETTIPAVGNSFCMLSSYRAEESRTRRHLTEYQHLEAEMPFITFDDLLNHIEDLICDVIQRVLDSPYGALLKEINPNIAVPKRPFKRMNYTDALKWLEENNVQKPEGGFYTFGDDIPEMPERKMTDTINEPIFLCRFPVEVKAFYMPKCPEDKRLTDSCDLLMPGVGEIVGGSMRIWSYDDLMAAYKREGLDPSPYYWFTDQRKYGSVPHGGYGLGVERLLVWLFNDNHIRNVCLYPRYFGRCSP